MQQNKTRMSILYLNIEKKPLKKPIQTSTTVVVESWAEGKYYGKSGKQMLVFSPSTSIKI